MKRLSIFFMFLLLMTVGLAGCSSQPSEKPSPNHPVSESEKVHQQEQQMDQSAGQTMQSQPPAPEPNAATSGD
ncbi:hypothetical protein CWRG_01832 [Chthonomonas calidirosea]|uniref:Prokaryotic membrane lipoprotein lipid attachment site n=1 Tax=Chthonomonas calidirosea (strain DSM 23976 / ICMP 18418 / T49) TaxID=1303518 RepID=S0EX75_CHTCT|nr:hypothetical protein [Chthonomonas calidirosea]CCW36052.1 hypothetical protein CCALI_02245 [Chthonomonas calidirosea T49]CEK17430.1 hypothetical protein CP488_01849 [Chthonomonas calidirosea]CEK17431.1 hypothetical protein CWRG_01832 [Chthonomonas calidirosea]CEK18475.1 hypothetical protein CTKA_01850 [Chthonomonas calidirosea]